MKYKLRILRLSCNFCRFVSASLEPFYARWIDGNQRYATLCTNIVSVIR